MTQTGPQYPPQLNARLGQQYHRSLRVLADVAGVTLADYLRAVIEVLAHDRPLQSAVSERAHHLQGPPGQQ